ncbi:prepilin-type N-terminal cleavage/methylation domain-containing protein [Candidatus Saccharibacteria bacterium]|nr:prepilin-type N-terminal cleavage/methylation domain-containing protein [Candidatus Saccharibacteria bacterium]
MRPKATQRTYYQTGFTIVELLVVIVVIGVLATISVVSYSGISQRATIASLQSDLNNNSKKLKMYYVLYGSYPTSLNGSNCPSAPNTDNNYCLTGSGNTTYQYSGSSSTFCTTATVSNISYYISQNSIPTLGGCPGDIVSGSPAIANPSFESDTVGNLSYPLQWNQYGNVANNYEGVASDFSVYGTKSFKISQTTTDMDGGIWARISGLTIGQNVTVSVWIKSGAGVANASLNLCTSQHGLTGNKSVSANQGANVNGRFSVTMTSVDQTSVDLFLGQGSWGLSSRGDVWFDGVQVTIS